MIGILEDDTDPMVNVMKLEKAPKETYADIGGLDAQVQEMKVGLCSLPSLTPFHSLFFVSILLQN